MKVDLVGKKLLVLGGTQISCEIITKAQSMGIKVAVTDYNSVEDSPGKQIADESFMVSATDVDGVVKLLKDERFDGVIVGFNDMLLPYYAEICQKADLPSYGTKEQFEVFVDKDKYKSLCRKHGVPTVEEYTLSMETFDKDVEKIKFPVLIKPVDNSGSRGIFICHNKEELLDNYKKALEFSKTQKVLVEHYLTGKEVTVFFVFQDGEYYLSAIGNRHVKYFKEGLVPLPVGYTYPASVTDSYINDILPNVKSMLRELDIKDGMMFMQCKVEDGIVVAYDIGFRLTASLEYRMFEMACGYNPLEMMIRFALTGKMSEDNIRDRVNPYLGSYGYNISFLAEPGVIAEIQGLDAAESVDGVAGVFVSHFPGEVISESMAGLLAQITVRVVGIADNLDDLWKKIDQIQNDIKIISDKNINLIHRKMEKSDFEGLLK